MYTNTSIKNLLAVNKKALQGLHAIAHMDFNRDFVIIERTGSFTYNSIIKEINNITRGTGHCLVDYNNIFIIYINVELRPYGGVYVAKLIREGFQVQRKTIDGYEEACGWRWLNTVGNKKSFEEIRKSNGHYFIIAQSKDYEVNKPKTSIDCNTRYNIKLDTSGRVYAVPMWKNCDWYYDNINPRYFSYEFDKSGYIIGKINYELKLKAIKAKRSKEQATTYDNTEKIREFEKRISHVNWIIANELLRDNTVSYIMTIKYNAIERICRNISWIKSSLKQLEENKFDSMESIKSNIDWIEDHLSMAEKELENLLTEEECK